MRESFINPFSNMVKENNPFHTSCEHLSDYRKKEYLLPEIVENEGEKKEDTLLLDYAGKFISKSFHAEQNRDDEAQMDLVIEAIKNRPDARIRVSRFRKVLLGGIPLQDETLNGPSIPCSEISSEEDLLNMKLPEKFPND